MELILCACIQGDILNTHLETRPSELPKRIVIYISNSRRSEEGNVLNLPLKNFLLPTFITKYYTVESDVKFRTSIHGMLIFKKERQEKP